MDITLVQNQSLTRNTYPLLLGVGAPAVDDELSGLSHQPTRTHLRGETSRFKKGVTGTKKKPAASRGLSVLGVVYAGYEERA